LYNRVSYGNDGLSSYGVIINLFDRGRTLLLFLLWPNLYSSIFEGSSEYRFTCRYKLFYDGSQFGL